MAAWLESLPRFVLALIFVVGTTIFLYLSDPPKNICDTQLESVNNYLKDYFYDAREDGWSQNQNIKDKYAFCIRSNSLGGCSVFFERLLKLEKQMRKIPDNCSAHPLIGEIKKWHFNGMDLMARVAWGDAKPEYPYERKGWLDEKNLAMFCRLKKQVRRLYGNEELTK